MISFQTARIYLGLSIHDAIRLAQHQHHYIRVVEKDGKEQKISSDIKNFRINVVTEDNQIIKIVNIG